MSLNRSTGRPSLTPACPGSLHGLKFTKLSEAAMSRNVNLIPGQSYRSQDPQQVVVLPRKKILHLHQHHTLQRTSQFPCQKSCILNNK